MLSAIQTTLLKFLWMSDLGDSAHYQRGGLGDVKVKGIPEQRRYDQMDRSAGAACQTGEPSDEIVMIS